VTIADSDDPGPGQTGNGNWETPLCYGVQPPVLTSISGWGLPLAVGLLLGASIVHTRTSRMGVQSSTPAA
jgi:hypothetical protein